MSEGLFFAAFFVILLFEVLAYFLFASKIQDATGKWPGRSRGWIAKSEIVLSILLLIWVGLEGIGKAPIAGLWLFPIAAIIVLGMKVWGVYLAFQDTRKAHNP